MLDPLLVLDLMKMSRMIVKIKKIVKSYLLSVKKKFYLLTSSLAAPGTVGWFISTEIKYGGLETNVPRNKVSPKDPRTDEQLKTGGMTGGDRMLYHGYAQKYSEYLLPYFKNAQSITIVECGILKGVGVALWCDLFQNSRIIGLDIDLGHINNNMDNLCQLGAFQKNQPELYEFDQFIDNTEYIGDILKGDKINICIDDGFHSVESISAMLKSMMPYLADQFVYFIEDNREIHKHISCMYPELIVDIDDELSIITRA